jgi:hypothetical protein
MDWTSYISLAGDLVGQEAEASKRSAVSRAYYGAFNHLTRSSSVDAVDQRGGSHAEAARQLQERFQPGLP